VCKSYPSADGVGLPSGAVITVFNVKRNEYRLLEHLHPTSSAPADCRVGFRSASTGGAEHGSVFDGSAQACTGRVRCG
jgi:hypothetical protein